MELQLGKDDASDIATTSHYLQFSKQKSFMSPTPNHIAGFGLCASSLILSKALYIVFSSGI